MSPELQAGAEQIRLLLMPFAFVLCVIGMGEMGWRAGSDPRAILGAVLKVVLIVSLIASYPAAIEGGQEAFKGMRDQFTDARDAQFIQLLRSRIENQPSDSLTDIGKIIPAAIAYFFQGIGRFMLVLLEYFQNFAIAGLLAVSPLLLGFLFFSYTQSVGLQFCLTSLTVLLWHLAICLVDITIVELSEVFFGRINGGTVTLSPGNLILVNNWLMFPFLMAFATLVTVFFYLSVPFVAGAIMKGISGTTAALQAGVQGSMRAAGFAVGTGLTVAGAAATVGGSAAAQGALAGTQAAAGGARAAGRLGNDLTGSVTGNIDDVPPPPPVPPSPSSQASSGAGGSNAATNDNAAGGIINAVNPSMFATQTAPGMFAVVDQDRGTVSHHRGTLTTPQAVEAAFNSHSATAQPLPPDSPLAGPRHS
jgi:hypothetical protein